jgi:hypothetical protein
MWLFTNVGFVSVVKGNNALIVRSRDRESLEPIAHFAKTEIFAIPDRDYPYRLYTVHETFAQWAAHMARGIVYENFKSEVASTRGKSFASALGKVWSVMHDVEDPEARNNVK